MGGPRTRAGYLQLRAWFVLERRLNGQRQQPGWIQFRHEKSRIERWKKTDTV